MRPQYLKGTRIVQAAVRVPAEIRPPAENGDDTLDVEIAASDASGTLAAARSAISSAPPLVGMDEENRHLRVARQRHG